MDGRRSVLAVSAAGRLCALPIAEVEETMRPASVEPVLGAPAFVLGVARVRGSAIPVVDLGAFLGAGGDPPTRWVTIRLGERRAVLAVSSVDGVHHIDDGRFGSLPPLLSIAPVDHIDAITVVDDVLVTVIRPARILPASFPTWLDGAELAP
jgi:purine-binding chemotaxis protein CheW